MNFPYYQAISYQNPLAVFQIFSSWKGSIFLDSASGDVNCGRYSFIAVDPFLSIQHKNTSLDPFCELKKSMREFPLALYPDLPPFQGGVAGYFSYDLCHYLEKLPRTEDDMEFPDLIVGFYDLVIAFDHQKKSAWIFSSGYPEKNNREAHAKQRCEWLKNYIEQSLVGEKPIKKISVDQENIHSNFTQENYEAAVQKVKEYILAGDIFEANISQRFKTFLPKDVSAWDLYQSLRNMNPAPFSAFLNWDEWVVASASPERFLKLNQQKIETRPIKGTIRRGKTAKEDNDLANQLLQSEKDRAENIMIVDLLRNDLSKVAKPHSVIVKKLCGLESFATVHHLVSVIHAELDEKYHAMDLLCATFPGGSITGAPKIRAMEIIAEIEPHARGPYCGSIGYIGFNGEMDLSITIRSFLVKNNCVTFQVGGAVTLGSDPTEEYVETLAKANALMRTIT